MPNLEPEEIEELLRDPSNNIELNADKYVADIINNSHSLDQEDSKIWRELILSESNSVKIPQVVAAWLAWCSWMLDEEV